MCSKHILQLILDHKYENEILFPWGIEQKAHVYKSLNL